MTIAIQGAKYQERFSTSALSVALNPAATIGRTKWKTARKTMPATTPPTAACKSKRLLDFQKAASPSRSRICTSRATATVSKTEDKLKTSMVATENTTKKPSKERDNPKKAAMRICRPNPTNCWRIEMPNV